MQASMLSLFILLSSMLSCQAAITAEQAEAALGTGTGLKYATQAAGKAMTVEVVGDSVGGIALVMLTMLEAASATAADIGWAGVASGLGMMDAEPIMAYQEGGEWKLTHRKAFTAYDDSGDAGASTDIALVPELCSKSGASAATVAFTIKLDTLTPAWTLDSMDFVAVRATEGPDADVFPFHDLASASMTLAFEDFAGGSGGSTTDGGTDEADTSNAESDSDAGIVKTSTAGGSAASASGGAPKASSTSTSGSSKDASAEALVEGSSCKIAKDSPYAAYADFFVCAGADRNSGNLANAMLLALGIGMILL